MAEAIAAEVWREPARGSFPDPRILQLSGLEQIQANFRGKWARPPVQYLLGLKCTLADEEHAVFEQPITGWMLDSDGRIPAAAIGVIADSILGCAITAHLPPRTPFATSELSINFVAGAELDGEAFVGDGRLIDIDRSVALSEGYVRDRTGRLLAQCTSRCVLLPQLPEMLNADGSLPTAAQIEAEVPHSEPPPGTAPDPFLRQPEGRPPLQRLIGLRPVELLDGAASFALPASLWLTIGFGTVMGGFIALLAQSAMSAAVQTTAQSGERVRQLDLKLNFLRPVFADQGLGELVAKARVAHRGRSLSVATAEVSSPEGKVVALATGSALIEPA